MDDETLIFAGALLLLGGNIGAGIGGAVSGIGGALNNLFAVPGNTIKTLADTVTPKFDADTYRASQLGIYRTPNIFSPSDPNFLNPVGAGAAIAAGTVQSGLAFLNDASQKIAQAVNGISPVAVSYGSASPIPSWNNVLGQNPSNSVPYPQGTVLLPTDPSVLRQQQILQQQYSVSASPTAIADAQNRVGASLLPSALAQTLGFR